MADQPMTLFQDLVTAVLTVSGDTSSSLRTTLAHQSACTYGGPAPLHRENFPAQVETFIQKVALHAYRTSDQDIEQLREHNYTEDAIFEIALSAAAGVGQECLAWGLKALEEAKNEIKEH